MFRTSILALGLAVAALGCSTVLVARAETTPATQPATAPADFGNTKCMVMPDDDIGKATYVYEGTTYHFCCKDCLGEFKKDPEKYIKAAKADPAKYGTKQ